MILNKAFQEFLEKEYKKKNICNIYTGRGNNKEHYASIYMEETEIGLRKRFYGCKSDINDCNILFEREDNTEHLTLEKLRKLNANSKLKFDFRVDYNYEMLEDLLHAYEPSETNTMKMREIRLTDEELFFTLQFIERMRNRKG